MGSLSDKSLSMWAPQNFWQGLNQYRALSWATLNFIKSLFGHEVFYFRLFNLLLHTINGFLIYFLSRQLLKKDQSLTNQHLQISFSAALIFLINPVAVYGVAYTIQMSIVMATAFSLVSLWLFAKGLDRQNIFFLLLSAFFYYLGLRSKEHIIMLPAICGLLILYYKRYRYTDLKLYAVPFLIFAAIGFQTVHIAGRNIGQVYEQWSGNLQSSLNPENAQNLLPNEIKGDWIWLRSILNQMGFYFRYLISWVTPFPRLLSIDIPLPFPAKISTLLLSGAAAYLIYGSIGFYLLLKKSKFSLLGLLMLVPWALFVTEFAVVRQHESFVLYRSYFWMSLSLLSLPWLFYRYIPRFSPALIVFYCGLLVWSTQLRLNTFQSPLTLWEDATQKINISEKGNFAAYRPFVFLGGHYSRLGHPEKAVKALETAIQLNPNFYLSYYNLGLTYIGLNQPQKAIDSFTKAIQLSPNSTASYYNLGNLYIKIGQSEKAIPYYLQALKINPGKVDIHHNLGIAYFQSGLFSEALNSYQKVLSLNPKHPKAYYNMGNVFMTQRQTQKAIQAYGHSLQINPHSHLTWHNQALGYLKLGELQKAKFNLQNALKIKPDFVPSQQLLKQLQNQ